MLNWLKTAGGAPWTLSRGEIQRARGPSLGPGLRGMNLCCEARLLGQTGLANLKNLGLDSAS